jgi:hypothetical integral membrane protein (TIGR02206 family)
MPTGVSWEHFDGAHLTYLIGFTLATVVLALVYRHAHEARRAKIRIAYACIVIFLELAKQIICLLFGVYEPGLLPFHLCGMSIIFITVHTFWPNKTTAELLYSLSLPGAIAALLFADWTVYPLVNIFCQQSFFIHFFEFSFPVLLLSAGELRPRFTQLWRCALFLLVVVPPIYFFNHTYDTNFFFLNVAAPGSPLSFLQSSLGNPGYLFGFIALVVALWLVMYLPWILKTLREQRVPTPQVTEEIHSTGNRRS